jgi:hypothetical protein
MALSLLPWIGITNDVEFLVVEDDRGVVLLP